MNYRYTLKRHFNFGKSHLDDILPQDVMRRIDKLSNRPSEQQHAYVIARTFFRWALDRNYLTSNPLPARTPRRAVSRDRVLSDEELKSVYTTATEGTDFSSHIVTLLILTGQRRGETAALQRPWIDTQERTITIPTDVAKNHTAHTFPYGDLVEVALECIPHTHETYLFPVRRNRRKDNPATVFNGWSKPKIDFDAKLENVEPWTLHDLRRTFATKHAELGTPIHVTEKLLNHISGSHSGVVAVYQRHTWLPEMREAVERYDTYLSELVS
ncbi:MAG: tyrosine-type recombinase/integrase [Rhodospirillaceae bacterium]|nr:tyrosine-type recombinase/integrase [Rhodospirillaceae bacterium]